MKTNYWILVLVSMTTAQVGLFPSGNTVTTTSSNVTFRCISLTNYYITRIDWLLNGSTMTTFSNVRTGLSSFSNGIGSLKFVHVLLEYNNTIIQCNATLNPSGVALSPEATLLVQGSLPLVNSLSFSLILLPYNSIILLEWMAPFTLDISDSEPDISYCVDVVNSTSSATLHSECGINNTNFSYLAPLDGGCHDHMITVTPVNVIGEGEHSTIVYSHEISAPQVPANYRVVPMLLQPTLCYHINMTSPVCYAEMELTDKSSGEIINFKHSDIEIVGLNNIVFTSEKLQANSHYTALLNATNVNGSALTILEVISTHDIIDVIINRNPVSIQAEYVSNSRAAGGMFVFLPISTDRSRDTVIDFSRSVYICLDRNTSLDGHVLPFQLSPGEYFVAVYDIEENGRVSSGMLNPADTTTHSQQGTIQNSNQPMRSTDIEDCNVTITNHELVSALCTHSAGSLSAQGGFVMLVQRNDLNVPRAQQLLVNETTQGAPAGPVTVQVEENGIYHVAIFPKTVETGIVNSTLAFSVELTATMLDLVELRTMDINYNNTFPTESPTSNMMTKTAATTTIIISVGTCLGLLLIIIAFIVGAILAVQCKRASSAKLAVISDKNGMAQKASKKEDSPEYAEIKDIKSSFSYTKNVVYGMCSLPAVPQSQEYDNVKVAQPVAEPDHAK